MKTIVNLEKKNFSVHKKRIISLTERALVQVKHLLEKRGKASLGIRIGVRLGGCSGFKYFIEYADEKGRYDEVIEDQGLSILIDPKAVMYLLGTRMDYIKGKFKSGFVFLNPNEKGKCGCGTSFNV